MRRFVPACAATAVAVLVLGACGSSSSSGGPAPILSVVTPISGPATGGTAVTLGGENFQTGATVQFGSAQATGVSVTSANTINATTPQGAAGSVNVTVTNPDGQTSVLADAFTYSGASDCVVPASVTANLTLDTSCSVWSAPATVVVGGATSPVLTILPGTTIAFLAANGGNQGASLQVAVNEPGGLVAIGTSNSPIVFTSAAATPAAGDWGGVVIGPQSLSSTAISYAVINYAGGAGANDLSLTADTAALTVEGGDVVGGTDQSPAPVLSYLSMNNSAGHGLVFAGFNTGFGVGSSNISVTAWEPNTHYAYVIEANQAGTLPASLAAPTGGATAVVALHSYADPGFCQVAVTQTWPALTLPYLAVDEIDLGANIGDASATLTITAPNTIQFVGEEGIYVDGSGTGTGFLQVNGDATHPVVFTSNSLQPTPSSWSGINFYVGPGGQANSSLNFATISYARNPFPNAYGYGSIALFGSGSENALVGPSITNCTINHYGTDFGIVMVDITSENYLQYSSTGGNTFDSSQTVSSSCSTSDCTDAP